MSRRLRTPGLAAVLGFGLAMLASSPAEAFCHKNPFAKAPSAAGHARGLKLTLPRHGLGCGLKLPKLGQGHKARACETVAPIGPRGYAPVSVMPAAPVPSDQGGATMPGFRSPGYSMPAAPGLKDPGLGAPGVPTMPGVLPPVM